MLKKKYSCEACSKFWILRDGDDHKSSGFNFLINCKEYVANGLVTPTAEGNQIFHSAEEYFKSNRFNQRDKKGLTKILTNLIFNRLLKDFDAPSCHFEKIIQRFVSNRRSIVTANSLLQVDLILF